MLLCCKCRARKPESEFYKLSDAARRKRGRDYMCKSCRATHRKEMGRNMDHKQQAIRHLMRVPDEAQLEVAAWIERRYRARKAAEGALGPLNQVGR